MKTSVKIQPTFRELHLIIKIYEASGGISTNRKYPTILMGVLRALIKNQLDQGIIEDISEHDAKELLIARAREADLDLHDPKLEHLNSLAVVESEVHGSQAQKIVAALEKQQAEQSVEGLDLFGISEGDTNSEEN